MRIQFRVLNMRTGNHEIEYYVNVQNVIRYGLRKDKYPPGQYDIYNMSTDESTRAYKKA